MLFGRRFIVVLAGLLLTLALASCGGDDSAPTDPGTPDSTQTFDVTINTGLWEAVAGEGLVPEIPAAVTEVRFTVHTNVSSNDLDVTVNPGDQTVHAVMPVPADMLCRIECRGRDVDATTLYTGVGFITRVVEDDMAVINLVDANDTTPPTMTGTLATTPLSNHEVLLEWDPATEDGDEATDAIYLVWVEGWPERAKADTQPWTVSMAGVTGLVIGGLYPEAPFDFTIKAVDPAGNDSAGSLNGTATPLAANFGLWVDANVGVDGPDCGEPGSPCRSITQALDLSDPGEPIYISQGTYNEAGGETFPLVLKDGTRLVGDVAYPRGIPLSVIEVGTADAVIEVPVSGSLVGLWIDNSTGGAGRIIDAREGDLRLDRVHIEGLNSQAAIHIGAEAVIVNTHIEGLTSGNGIGAFGDENKQIISCIIEDCGQGILIQGHNTTVHGCLVQDCIMGIAAFGFEAGDTGDLSFSRNLILNNDNGFDLQKVSDTRLLSNLVWKNTQMGVHLREPDSTVQIIGCHIDGADLGGNTGVYVRRGNPIIDHSTLVCSRVNLFVEGTGLVTATQNHWDNNPPVVTERPDDEACLDSDICYDGEYSGTPVPLWSPNYARTSCLVIAIVPHLTVQDLPALLDRVWAAVE